MRLLRDSRRFVIVQLDGDRSVVCSPTRPRVPGEPASISSRDITQTTVTLDWGLAQSVHPLGAYRVYRGATKVYDGPARTFADTGLTAGSQVSYTVKAVDVYGGEGPGTTPLVVTLLSAPPNLAIVGAMTTDEPLMDGRIEYQPPTPIPGRALTGAASTSTQRAAGSIANTPTADLPPVWNEPAVDTTYSYNEGDTVDIILDADDPEGHATSIFEKTGIRPQDVSLIVTPAGVWKLYGVLPAGSGGYPQPRIYDSNYEASDVTAVEPVDIVTSSIPAGQANVAYSATFAASGGQGPPYYYSLETALPAPLDVEVTMNTTTGVLSGTPSVAFTGPISVKARDPQSDSKTKQFTLTIAPAATNDQATRLATPGTLFGSNFRDVYLGNGTTAAVLTPARQINNTAQLLASPYGDGGHEYTVAEGLYGQVRNGVLQGPFADGTSRAELDTATFGFPTLRLPGRANDGRQGGSWTCPIDGLNGALYRRVYVRFRIFFDEEAIACAWSAPSFDHKIFMLGSNQDGQVVLASKKNTGALTMYWDVSHNTGEIPGIVIPSSQNPWPRDVRRIYNAVDMGDPTLDGSQNTTTMQDKFSENYGPLDNGFNWGGYQYIADQKYLARRDASLLPNGYPDSKVFKNCHPLRHSTWQDVQLFAEKHVGEDLLSIEYWLAPDNQPYQKLFTAVHNVPLSGGANDSYFSVIQALEYATDRVRQSALDRNTWIREVQTSLKPIPGPGGFLPPNNRG